MSIVARPIKRGSRQLILLCIYLSLSMWTTFAMYSLQIYKYSKDCPQYSDMIILYDTELDANIILRDEIAIGFQKHRVLINKMLKDNPSLLPHIINFLMNSYGEHIGFDLMQESSAKDFENKQVEMNVRNNATCCPHKKTSKTLKILTKRSNIKGSGTGTTGIVSVVDDKFSVSTSKSIKMYWHTKYMEKLADNVNAINGSVIIKILQGNNNDRQTLKI